MSHNKAISEQSNNELKQQLSSHLDQLNKRWQQASEHFDYSGIWLSAGEAQFNFQDDHGPKFIPNPYLSQWVDPQFLSPSSRLYIEPGKVPVLFLHTPTDYWHAPAPIPREIEPRVEIRTFAHAEELLAACQQTIPSGQRTAHIGPVGAGGNGDESIRDNEIFGDLNPAALLNYLHFHRARKSEFEFSAMRSASDIGAQGHLAARQAFMGGGTEFDIHMSFLQASQQSEIDLPYGNIVAQNEHASVLHYQFQDRSRANPVKSLLIDAGGKFRGYASDITRTYTLDGSTHAEFSSLIELIEAHQMSLINSVRPGMTFADLHVQMHQQLAQVLVDANLVNGSAEAAFAAGCTEIFCPHGLGHLLGLQVHDVGGHLADENGNSAPPPSQYPTLRFTREIEVDQVFTIEPGVYFIPSLLADARSKNKLINWPVVERLRGYGGIRIEDNVRVLPVGVENFTRDAFARAAANA